MNQFSTAFCYLLPFKSNTVSSGVSRVGGGAARELCGQPGRQNEYFKEENDIVCSNSLNYWDKLKRNSISNRFYKFIFTFGAAIVITHPDRQKHLSTSLLLSPLFSNTSGLWSFLGRLIPHPLLDNVNTQLVLSVFTSTPQFHSYHSVFAEQTDYISAVQKLMSPTMPTRFRKGIF